MKKNKNIFADIKNMTGVEQLVARRAHNPEAGGSSPSPATKQDSPSGLSFFCPHYPTFCIITSLPIIT